MEKISMIDLPELDFCNWLNTSKAFRKYHTLNNNHPENGVGLHNSKTNLLGHNYITKKQDSYKQRETCFVRNATKAQYELKLFRALKARFTFFRSVWKQRSRSSTLNRFCCCCLLAFWAWFIFSAKANEAVQQSGLAILIFPDRWSLKLAEAELKNAFWNILCIMGFVYSVFQ